MLKPLLILACLALTGALPVKRAEAQTATSTQADFAEYQRACFAERQTLASSFQGYGSSGVTGGFRGVDFANIELVDNVELSVNVPPPPNGSPGRSYQARWRVLRDVYGALGSDPQALDQLAAQASAGGNWSSMAMADQAFRLLKCALRVRAQQLRRSPGQRAAPPPTTTAVAPPARAAATTPIAPRPPRMMTAAEAQWEVRYLQENVNKCGVDSARWPSIQLRPLCRQLELQLEEARAMQRQVLANPSIAVPYSYSDALDEAWAIWTSCSRAGGWWSIANCRPNMDAINAERRRVVANSTPVAPQAAASTPQITPPQAAQPSYPELPARDQVRSRIVAGSGRDAMDCVVMVRFAESDSRIDLNRVVINRCDGPVEAFWCYLAGPSGDDCNKSGAIGNTWTVPAGERYPLSANGEIRWGACRGINSGGFEQGQAGLRFICTGPPYASGARGPVSRSSSTASDAPKR